MPAAASTYALPAEWRERWALRKYGFHGLSHAYAARRAAAMVERPLAELRIVTCHLGAGASLAAIRGGRSVDTTMGFTPLDGLVMATRSGSVDPGPRAVARGARRDAGVGAGRDARAPLRPARASPGPPTCARSSSAEAAGDEAAGARRRASTSTGCAASIGAMAAALGGLDVLVFTGGVGENAPAIRERVAAGLALPRRRARRRAQRRTRRDDADIGAAGAPVRTLVDRAPARTSRSRARCGACWGCRDRPDGRPTHDAAYGSISASARRMPLTNPLAA